MSSLPRPAMFEDGVDEWAPATKSKSWIMTYTGRRFDPFNIDPKQIVIEDIAHALSNICRYTGHCKSFYSVAEHSVWVSTYCNEEDALYGLLHDASEAYLMDLARPVKHHPAMQVYRDVEAELQEEIFTRFGIDYRPRASVKEADGRILISEATTLMANVDDWNWPYKPYEGFFPYCFQPVGAEAHFMRRWRELTC